MTMMQGWGAVEWEWITLIMTIMTGLAVWYFVIVGRDRKPTTQRRGEETIERYGDIEEDRAPVSKFLIYTYVGIAVWAVGYAISTGVFGLF